jgi:hypothetical protein
MLAIKEEAGWAQEPIWTFGLFRESKHSSSVVHPTAQSPAGFVVCAVKTYGYEKMLQFA